jgi:ATP-dependent RNA helicase RhlE
LQQILKYIILNFSDLNLSTPLLNALDDQGITTPTLIQERAFSPIMSGKDLVGVAQTGTGKTLAYLLPCLRQWKFQKDKAPQILIIVPTRELVMQVVGEVEKLTTYMNATVLGIYGGTNIKTQTKAVYAGCDVLVATPGRLFDIMVLGVLKLKSIKKLVVDEMDEMLNLGFRPQIISILDILPQKRQNLLFSATLTEDVESFINEYFYTPDKIEAAPSGTPLKDIVQSCYELPNFYTKVNLLKLLITEEGFDKVLIFSATKKLADQLFEEVEDIFPDEIGVIHSNKSQNNRFKTVDKFHTGEYRILIATDIVARGVDISEVTHVINFDVPEVPENYIHRIGRTGRADKKGNAILFTTAKDAGNLVNIEGMMKQTIALVSLPEELEISEMLAADEIPQISEKEINVKAPKKEDVGSAFHEKLEKNLKTRIKITRNQAMKKKYKRPKTRGQKRK